MEADKYTGKLRQPKSKPQSRKEKREAVTSRVQKIISEKTNIPPKLGVIFKQLSKHKLIPTFKDKFQNVVRIACKVPDSQTLEQAWDIYEEALKSANEEVTSASTEPGKLGKRKLKGEEQKKQSKDKKRKLSEVSEEEVTEDLSEKKPMSADVGEDDTKKIKQKKKKQKKIPSKNNVILENGGDTDKHSRKRKLDDETPSPNKDAESPDTTEEVEKPKKLKKHPKKKLVKDPKFKVLKGKGTSAKVR